MAVAHASSRIPIPAMDDKLIDEPLADRLGDGTIRLLSCRWLLDEATSDAALGRGEGGEPLMRRLQELPQEAFVAAAEKRDDCSEIQC